MTNSIMSSSFNKILECEISLLNLPAAVGLRFEPELHNYEKLCPLPLSGEYIGYLPKTIVILDLLYGKVLDFDWMVSVSLDGIYSILSASNVMITLPCPPS